MDRIGTWESLRLTAWRLPLRPASGRRRADADDERSQAVRPGHSSCEVAEQRRLAVGGGDGAKGRGRGEREPAKHAPDSVRETRDTCAGARTTTSPSVRCRHHPRWEPYAGKPHVRFYAGGVQQCTSLPRSALVAVTQSDPKAFEIAPPLGDALCLRTANYRASFS